MAQEVIEPPQGMSELRKENGLLRAQTAALRERLAVLQEELALRDHALDATPTLFLIAKYGPLEPTVVYCNKIVADQHGTSREELLGTSVNLLTQWRANSATTEIVEATLRAGEMFRYEGEVTRCDGSTFWLGMTVRPLFDAAGELSHSVSIGADITARREEEMKKSELRDKLIKETADREQMAIEWQEAQRLVSLGRLAAGIVHQIATPIQYVEDSVQFLRTSYGSMSRMLDTWRSTVAACGEPSDIGELRVQLADIEGRCGLDHITEEEPKQFARLLDGVQQVAIIVDAMREFARPPLRELAPTDVNAAVRTTLIVATDEYKYVAAIRTDFGELPLISANVSELHQVLLGLVLNAARAIRQGGDLNRGEISIATSYAAGVVTVTVGDNGPGLSPQTAAKLFDSPLAVEGTGRGMATARAIIVNRHGGDLSVTSAPGAGTTFMIRLPAGGAGS